MKTKHFSISEHQQCCRHATSISFASSDHSAIFALADETCRTYLYQRIELTGFKLAMTFHQHKAPINSLSFAPITLCFASAASGRFVSMISSEPQNLSVQTCKIATSLQLQFHGHHLNICFSSNNQTDQQT